jgi:capsular polysaccharide biosynthesis protein
VKRRFRAGDFDGQQDDASAGGSPAPGAITPAQTRRPTNGHGAPTLVEHVGNDIVVWPAADEDAWASNGVSSAGAGSFTTESADDDEADEWLGVGGAGSRFVNLHFVLGEVKRRRRWVIGCAVAGLVVGLLLSVASSATPRAETKVLLTFPSASDPARAMLTDAQLLETDAVARRVVDALHLPESPAAFTSSYSGLGLSDNLLSISVSAPSSSAAVRRANALAHEYLAYRAEVYQHQSDAIVEGLKKQQETIQGQISELDRQLGAQADAITSTDPPTANQLATRDGLNNRYNQLNDSIAAQTDSIAAVVAGSFVIDQATPIEPSLIKEVGRNALSGLAAGLGIGLALVVLLAVTSNRVWRRDDVAEAMRHSVNLSTGPIRVRRRLANVALRKLIAHPTPELAKVVSHLRDQLATRAWGDRSLAVIAVGGLEVAAASVGATATALARDGEDVVVIDASEQNIVSGSRLLRERESSSAGGPAGGGIRLVSLADGRKAPSVDAEQVVLVLAMLDPAEGAERIRAFAPNAVAIVTAGRSTMTSLRAVSDMLEVAHVELASVVLVGSSGHDESFGRHVGARASAPAPGDESDTWSVSAAGP